MNVFVYGTLKQGGMYHAYLKGAKLIEKDALASGTLYDTGFGYPAMTAGEDGTVAGEVYEVPDELWAGLDEVEDCTGSPDDLYEKITAEVKSPSGSHQAVIYVAKKENLLRQRIENGIWINR